MGKAILALSIAIAVSIMGAHAAKSVRSLVESRNATFTQQTSRGT
jgi:hypothetical protein